MADTSPLERLLGSSNGTRDPVSTSSCANSSGEEWSPSRSLDTADFVISTVCISVAMVTGLPGNAMVLLTFSRMALSPATLYLLLLAVSDFACLFLLGSTFCLSLARVDKGTSDVSRFACSFFQALSNWILVLICLERFVSVRCPFQKSRMYTLRKTSISACVVFLVNIFSHILKYLEVFHHGLTHRLQSSIVNFAYICYYFFLPACAIAVFSTLTAVSLCQSVRWRNTAIPAAFRQSSQQETHLTRLMFATTICFVVFMGPIGTFVLVNRIKTIGTDYVSTFANPSLYLSYFTWFAFFNNAVNFYIYLACSTKFRGQCSRMLFGTQQAQRI